MANYTQTPWEILVITQHVASVHLCYLLTAISLIQVTSINLFPTIISFCASLQTLQSVRKIIN